MGRLVLRLFLACMVGVAVANSLFALTEPHPRSGIYFSTPPMFDCPDPVYLMPYVDPWTGMPHGRTEACGDTIAVLPASAIYEPGTAIPLPAGFLIGFGMTWILFGILWVLPPSVTRRMSPQLHPFDRPDTS